MRVYQLCNCGVGAGVLCIMHYHLQLKNPRLPISLTNRHILQQINRIRFRCQYRLNLSVNLLADVVGFQTSLHGGFAFRGVGGRVGFGDGGRWRTLTA